MRIGYEWVPDHTLGSFWRLTGGIHWLDQGHSLRFKIRRVPATAAVRTDCSTPSPWQYSLTLHEATQSSGRIRQRAPAADQGRRRGGAGGSGGSRHAIEGDRGRPYSLESADKLIADFFAESVVVLAERGVADEVLSVSEPSEES